MKDFLKISDLIIENNNQYIIANKPAGMPCVPDKTGDKNLKNYLEAYSKHDLYIITRIDRPISGITIYAKSAKAATAITNQLKNRTVKKIYWAIVEGKPNKSDGILEDYVIKTRSNKAVVVDKSHEEAKLANLEYKTLVTYDNYTGLEVGLITGRFHQIRVQMANNGCIIKGDVKYGARRKNNDRSIHLHSYSISFLHPVSEEQMSYAAIPSKEDSLWKIMTTNIHDTTKGKSEEE
ncbi:MAG: RNA pseudouridine synthase [Saprospiraceae bacterium]